MRSAQQDETTGHLATVGLGHNRMDMTLVVLLGVLCMRLAPLLLLACFWAMQYAPVFLVAASNIIRS